MTRQIPSSLKGFALIAMPSLADPNFNQSVTCISEHTRDGAVGIVISRAHASLSAGMIFNELEIACTEQVAAGPVHIGGPVHQSELFVLHGPPLQWDQSLAITSDLAMSNSRSILEAIAMEKGPAHYIIALGCAGWGAGQLEWELRQNAWLTVACEHDLLFKTPVDSRWHQAMQRLGIDPAQLTDAAGHA